MSLKKKGLSCFLLCSIAFSASTFAGGYATIPAAQSPGGFALIGALGIAQLQADNGRLGVTSSETDTLVQTYRNNGWNTFAAQAGVGYLQYFGDSQRYPQNTEWFPSIEPELNVYYLGMNHIKGDVLRFNSPSFNQLTYKMPIDSTRLMLDAALTIVSKQWFSLYAIGGIGAAWNHVSYSDSDKGVADCVNQVLSLNGNTNTDFVWEAGGGLSFILGDSTSLFVEYLYTDLGKGQSSANGTSGTITTPVIVPASTNLSAQTGLLGLQIAI